MHPNLDERQFLFRNEVEFQLSIGAKLLPSYPIRSNAEFFYNLKKSIGIHDSIQSVAISPFAYRFNKFIIGIDCEKVLQAAYTGMNTKNGEMIRLNFTKLGSGPGNTAERIYTVLHCDTILNIKDTGVELFD